MIARNGSVITLLALSLSFLSVQDAAAQYAAAVVSYEAGITPAVGYTTPSSALGEPERFTGEGVFPGIVSPFNPPWRPNEIVSVGEGGQITLRLLNYAVPRAFGPEIGVFENVGFIFNPENGGTYPGPQKFGDDRAIVDVSSDGLAWTSVGEIDFNIPSNGYADAAGPFEGAPGSVPSDFRQPFTGTLSDFTDRTWPEVLEVLDGSGGGTWVDISATGLARVGYVRFSLPIGGLGLTSNFELDGVAIAHGAMGGVVPEPASAVILAGFAAAGCALFPRSLPRKRAG